MGNAFKRAAEDALRQLLERAAEEMETTPDRLDYDGEKVWIKDDPEQSMTYAQVAQSALRHGGPIVGKGSFAGLPSATTISAQAVKLRVDPETGQIELLRYAGCLDVGRAINPLACEGQIEGGTTQGISWGVMEEMLYGPDGKMWNPNLLDYRIPTTLDVPLLESLIVEVPAKHGPFGAKGIGEPPITPSIAAIASAVADATGVWINEAPLTPERVVKALQAARAASTEEQQEAA
jgi:CO/xanthine dehydrogenase Mo-binding subunit